MTATFRVRAKSTPDAQPSFAPPRSGVLERKCACGGAPGLDGTCKECRRKRLTNLQTKLVINQPGDRYEQEADRVAEKVMSGPSLLRKSLTALEFEEDDEQLQTKRHLQCSGPSTDLATAPPVVDEVLQTLGQPLDPGTRHFMEARFGYDFGTVRVHAGPRASASARAVQARAYTVGHRIVFGSGQYAPQTAPGRRLLAHELVHVLQQTGGIALRDQPQGPATGNESKPVPDALVEFPGLWPMPWIPVKHHPTGLLLSRQNTQQTASVLSQGAVASVQFIIDGTLNATRVGPVSQQTDVSVTVGRLTTIRQLAQVLLPLWNTATGFTPSSSAGPVPFAPLTADELAKGLLVFNRYRLAIPPASNPPVMTHWKIGMRFPLPIRIDSATNEGVLHPEMIGRLAGSFDPAWTQLLDELPSVLAAQSAAALQQSVADFLSNEPTTLARGILLGARAVANAQENQEFILEAFNQVGGSAFELALEFMNHRVNRDITILMSQTAGTAILNRIQALLALPPSGLSPAEQSSLDRANGMLGRVAALQPLPDPCIPNRNLTWDNFSGAVPAGPFEAETHFAINQAAYQGNQLFQVTLNQGASWVRPRSSQPGNVAVNGCQPQINACQAFFNGLPPGTVGAHWGLPGGPAPACPASIVPGAVTANNLAECTNVIGAECTRARQADSLRLLQHEQLHFDIPCVLVHKANAARAGGAALTLAAVRTRANVLTVQYDNQTNHGCNAAAQARWDADVAAGLPAQTFP